MSNLRTTIKISFLLFAGLLTLEARSYPDLPVRRNYFLQLTHHGREAELGYYEGKKYRKKLLYKGDPESLDTAKLRALLGLSEKDGGEVLVYLHCWLGNEKHFHRRTLKGLNKMTGQDTSAIKYTLSINWNSKLRGYGGNWRKALVQGNRLAPLFKSIAFLFPGRINVLSHSMGNRVLQGILQELNNYSLGRRKVIRELVLAAADVECDAFEKDYKTLSDLAERIYILKHRKDRLLRLAGMLTGKKRLGRSGPDRADSLMAKNKNIYLADVTETSSWRRPEPSNHLYFYLSPGVQQLLGRIYAHLPVAEAGRQNIFLSY